MRTIASLVILFSAFNASADCDDVVRQMRTDHLKGVTLCELQSRYKGALQQLSKLGVSEPRRIGNVLAPRFINRPDWIRYLSQYGDSEFAAWWVYKPSPKTWDNWSRAAAIIDNQDTEKNIFLEGSISQILSWILELHRVAMGRLLIDDHVGKFRSDVVEIIPLHSVRDAYIAEDIRNLTKIPYSSKRTGQKLMKFEAKMCDDLPQQARVFSGYVFRFAPMNQHEPVKACGDLNMAPPEEVAEQMELWAADIKQQFKDLSSGSNVVDLIELASKAQQWLSVIHPFIDGNGRMSRFMMDYILNEFNLPVPILNDMNRDFFTGPTEWADLVGIGMINTVEALERCVRDSSLLGCKVVSTSPPPAPNGND